MKQSSILKGAALLMAAAAIVSCTKTEIYDAPGASDVAIRLNSTHRVIQTGNSRAPFVDAISQANPLKARVISTETSGNYAAGFWADGAMTFMGGASSSYDLPLTGGNDKALFPSADGNKALYLAGLYPTAGWDLAGTPTVASATITGSKDLMAAAEVQTTANKVKATEFSTLTFQHLLTKVEVNARAVTSAAAGQWGKVKNIEIVKVKGAEPASAISVDMQSGSPVANTSGTAVMPFFVMSKTGDKATYTDTKLSADNAVTLTEGGSPVAYSIIAPFASGTDNDLEFLVYTEGKPTPDTVKVKLPTVAHTAGHAFSITFTFTANTNVIQALATVVEWNEWANIDAPVGE